MKRSTKKVLGAMVFLMIVVIAFVIVLTVTKSRLIPEQDLGQTVLAEKAAEQAALVKEEETTEEKETEPANVDIPNEKEVRLYTGGNGEMHLVKTFDSAWSIDSDIATFEAINSEEETINYGNYYTLHGDYWDAVETDTEYKIGYELSFDVDGETKVITILEPKDIERDANLYMGDYPADGNGNIITDDIPGYLGVWVYYDINQEGFYTHLTQDDMKEGVIMTSIKLRPTPDSDKISNLKLTAFSYSSKEEFNSSGRYIGTHGYTISINNKEA